MNVDIPLHTLPGSPVSAGPGVSTNGPANNPRSARIALQAVPKAGDLAVAGASGSASIGAAARLGLGAASAGADVMWPVDSFATRASQHVSLPPPAPGITHSGLDVPGFLLLVLAVAGFALRHLAGNRR